jgi:hypothetical protein
VPNDDGSAIFVDFDLSDASDISSYEIYGATWAFSDVSVGGDGPTTPLFVLNRAPELPVRIELLAGDTPILAGLDIWIAVVAVDASGNAYKSNLLVAQGQSIDNGGFSANDPLSKPTDVKVSWVNEKDILVQWQNPVDDRVDGMRIYILNEGYSTIDEADFVIEIAGATSFVINDEIYPNLVNTSRWYIAVAPFNTLGMAKDVIPVVLDSFEASTGSTNQNSDETEFSINALMSQELLLAIGLALLLLIILIMVVRGRGGSAGSGRVSKDWELQESTWGIETDSNWNETGYGTPQPTQVQEQTQSYQQVGVYGREVYQPAQPVLQPVQQPTQQFRQPTQNSPQNTPSTIDTSFLDDLL